MTQSTYLNIKIFIENKYKTFTKDTNNNSLNSNANNNKYAYSLGRK